MITGLAVALVVIGISAALSKPQHHTHTTAAGQTTPAYTPPPVPTPSPNGTYVGSCDYLLSSSLYGKDHLIGEVDLHNTGNIGTVVRVKITWPQEGQKPIARFKTVRTNPGAHVVVRFKVAVSSTSNVITSLQSWQEHHSMRDGCTYNATETDTFGSAQ